MTRHYLVFPQGLWPTSSSTSSFINRATLGTLLRPDELWPTSPPSCCTIRTLFIERVISFCKHCNRHGRSNNRKIKTAKAYTSVFTRLLNHPDRPHPPKSLSSQSQRSSWWSLETTSLSFWMLAWIDSEWSERFIQHIPSKSSQLWPCAKSKKSVAALFCNVAWRTLSTSNKRPNNALLVAFVCLASQQPSLSNVVNAFPEAAPGNKREAAKRWLKDQNSTLLYTTLCPMGEAVLQNHRCVRGQYWKAPKTTRASFYMWRDTGPCPVSTNKKYPWRQQEGSISTLRQIRCCIIAPNSAIFKDRVSRGNIPCLRLILSRVDKLDAKVHLYRP